MPKMDGITVLRKVREAGSQMPILMLTAKSEILRRDGEFSGLKHINNNEESANDAGSSVWGGIVSYNVALFSYFVKIFYEKCNPPMFSSVCTCEASKKLRKGGMLV